LLFLSTNQQRALNLLICLFTRCLFHDALSSLQSTATNGAAHNWQGKGKSVKGMETELV
jgi:hypothetical protein